MVEGQDNAAREDSWLLLLGPARVNFLILAPICVALGAAVAWYRGPVSWWLLALVTLGALLAHASVNLLNEYVDFKSGLDETTDRTPFSGGSGTLPEHPQAAPRVRAAGIATLLGVVALGAYFLYLRGWELLPLGLAGVVLVGAYSPWITRNPVLCLVAPGLGFGPLMVMGTEFVLTGSYSWTGFLVSLTPFFLVSNLLLVNQFPDTEPDRQVGRRHLPIVLGLPAAARIYAAFLVVAFIVPALGLLTDALPRAIGLALLVLPVALWLGVQVIRNAETIPRLVPLLGVNVIVVLVTPALLAVGLVIAA